MTQDPSSSSFSCSSDVERPQWTVGGRKRRRDAQLYKNPVESVATGGNEWWVGTYGGGDLSNTVEALLLEEALLQKALKSTLSYWAATSAVFHYHRDDDPNHTASVGKTQDFCTALHFLDNYLIAPDFTWPNHTVVWCTSVGQLCVADVSMQLQEEHLQTGFVPFLPELLKKFGFLNFSAPHSPTEILHLLENLLQLIRVI